MPRVDCCCCCIPWPKSWIKIPIVDLVNENVWVRWSVFLVMVDMFFSSLLYSQFWLLFPEENTTKALKECEDTSTILGADYLILFLNTLALLLCTSLANWYRAGTSTNKILKSFILVFILLEISYEVVNGIALNTKCYTEHLFSKNAPRIRHDFPFLNVGKQPRPLPDPLNITLATDMIINSYNDALSVRTYSSVILLLSCRFLVRYICIVMVPLILVMQFVSHFTKRTGKPYITQSFTANRLKAYLQHVKSLFEDEYSPESISANNRGKQYLYGSLSKSSDSDQIHLRSAVEKVDAIDDYWEKSDDNIAMKYCKMFAWWIKRGATSLLSNAKSFISPSRPSEVQFFPTRFIAGLIMSTIAMVLCVIIFEFAMVPTTSLLMNCAFLLFASFGCRTDTSKEAYLSCQFGLAEIIQFLSRPISVVTHLSVCLSLIIMLVTLYSIARRYKSEVLLQRKGTPSMDISKCNPIYASFYPGYQAAHTTVGMFTVIVGLFIILLICSFCGMFLTAYWTVFWKAIWEVIRSLSDDFKNQLISYLLITIGVRLAFQVFIGWFAKYLFFVHKSRFVRSVFSFSIVDAFLTVFGMFMGLFSALFTGLISQAAKTALLYVRLDNTSNPNFSTFAAVLKLDISHNNPVVLVFSHLMSGFAKKEVQVLEVATRTEPPVPLKYKNYWFLVATLAKNTQLKNARRSERSQYYDPAEH